MSITLQELHDAAKRIPASGVPCGRYLKVALHRPVEPLRRYDPAFMCEAVRYDTIEFEARPTKVHGHDAVAWYWHELLVKVTV